MKEYTCPECGEQTDRLIDIVGIQRHVCPYCFDNRPVHKCKKCECMQYAEDMNGDTCIDCVEMGKYYDYLDNFIPIEQNRIDELQRLLDAVCYFERCINPTKESIQQRKGYFPDLDKKGQHRINRWVVLRSEVMNMYLNLLNIKY